MKEWALERGATHYTHWFQPLTGSTAEKHDSFYAPTDRGHRDRGVLGQGADPGRARRVVASRPAESARRSRRAATPRGIPTSPAFILENPNGTLLCIPTAFASWTGEALDHKIPLLRSMDALSKSAIRALRLFGDNRRRRACSRRSAPSRSTS